jgi:hypothetical protein
VIAVSKKGSCPTEVTFSDGSSRWYFCGDLAAYKAAIESDQYPWRRTFSTHPPRIAGDPTG